MIRIAISQAAFDAICATLPVGSMGYENKVDENGDRLIWLPAAIKNVRGEAIMLASRTPDILADAAHMIFLKDAKSFSGVFF